MSIGVIESQIYDFGIAEITEPLSIEKEIFDLRSQINNRTPVVELVGPTLVAATDAGFIRFPFCCLPNHKVNCNDVLLSHILHDTCKICLELWYLSQHLN